MKKIAYLLSVVTMLGLGSREAAAVSKISGRAMGLSDAAAATTPVFDLNNVSRLSVQVNWASSTVANVSFTDGSKSVASVTVASAAYVFNSTPTLIINGVTLSYTPVVTATGTAQAISDAIMANSSLNTIMVSTWASPSVAVVSATSTVPGVNAYSITSSSWTALKPSNSIFTGGVAADLDSTTNIITKTNTYGIAQGVSLATTTNVALPGLTWGVTYYVIPVQAGTTFKLATTAANAVAGTAIDISTSSTGGGAFVLAASSTTTGASFVLQESNDNANWFTAVTTSTLPSITVGAPSGTTSVYFDLGFMNSRYFRFNYTPPTRGGLNVDMWFQGKNDD